MFNLYRASQMLFPGEKILDDANKFSHKFLTDKRSRNELLDKWVISKDLPGEVGYALDVPWYASLTRLEARYYLEQYGGDDDVWIGKTLYRMGNVNNNKYLEMAKLDYNHCQTIHQLEWSQMQKGAHTRNFYGHITRQQPAYLSQRDTMSDLLGPKPGCYSKPYITSIFTKSQFSNVDLQAFVIEFINAQHHDKNQKPWHIVMDAVHETLNQI
ncbi:terpenoid cyclases/protein prenyltransferase alpha-alpha toroid [Artemisia annua]|uniref:Terpenoid cyclases/protein prenyltransferase alpha-alpha toroid n=1 Tax=Artemisia annua TaxID=35608 RepID=A0A2U1L7C4_ARTAN|nr:terpenoid cyclases/protein prenyltransferase alpha-alpha toroid [Artemisia annua]